MRNIKWDRLLDCGARAVFGLIVFAVLAIAILLQPPKWLMDFDQSFYLTIAYDLDHHGTFSNGVFDEVKSSVATPPPGKFFGPVYPVLVLAAMKLDARFAAAVDCAVAAHEKIREGTECEVYATPMHLIHAALLTLGVLAIALAADIILASGAAFWLAGILATLALLPDADLFSFVMTESVTFALYSIAALALVRALRSSRPVWILVTGALFGLLALTRPSFVALAPVAVVLIAVKDLWLAHTGWRPLGKHALAFTVAWLAVVGPWLARNAVATGDWRLTEEYGSAALIERFAYDDMTAKEFALAFPYCVPVIGAPLIDRTFGPEAMARFIFYTPTSFFHVGRLHRDKLREANGRLDPLIADVVTDELRARWWRYVLVSLPLAWCGLWVGGILGLVLIPLFVWGCVTAMRQSKPLFLLYAVPALVMLGLHAAVANHYTRYNLILIGPFSTAAAWFIAEKARRRPSPIPAPPRRP
jgi:hypothetical protein